MSMSIEEAIRILDPETSADAITEIEYYAGFNRDKPIEKVNEAWLKWKNCHALYIFGMTKKRLQIISMKHTHQ